MIAALVDEDLEVTLGGGVVAEMMLESGVRAVAESVPVGLIEFVGGSELVVGGVTVGSVVLAATKGVTSGVGLKVAVGLKVESGVVTESVLLFPEFGGGDTDTVGLTVGGLTVPLSVGLTVGGLKVPLSVGLTVGGLKVPESVGLTVGGLKVPESVGLTVGGLKVPLSVGLMVGESVGPVFDAVCEAVGEPVMVGETVDWELIELTSEAIEEAASAAEERADEIEETSDPVALAAADCSEDATDKIELAALLADARGSVVDAGSVVVVSVAVSVVDEEMIVLCPTVMPGSSEVEAGDVELGVPESVGEEDGSVVVLARLGPSGVGFAGGVGVEVSVGEVGDASPLIADATPESALPIDETRFPSESVLVELSTCRLTTRGK
jgi:hypothetical protein